MAKILFILLSVLRVAFVGDPQVDSKTELGYARSSIYSELSARRDLDLVVVLGDLVNEKPELIAPSEALLDSTGKAWVRVQGNHDGRVSVGDSSFVAGGVRFILLDNVDFHKGRAYEGRLSGAQKRWLEAELAHPEPAVVCAHIPFWECKDRDSLALIFQKKDRLLLVSGHLHRVVRHRYPQGVEEVSAGATCGTWWRGVKDEFGVPFAIQGCGAPRGYFVSEMNPAQDKWYSLDYKCVQRPSSLRASVVEQNGNLVLNVFGGSPEADVFVRLDGKWRRGVPSKRIAPEAQAIIDYNKTLDRKTRKAMGSEFLPVMSQASTHIYVVPGVEKLPRKVKIRYDDGAMRFRCRISPGLRVLLP